MTCFVAAKTVFTAWISKKPSCVKVFNKLESGLIESISVVKFYKCVLLYIFCKATKALHSTRGLTSPVRNSNTEVLKIHRFRPTSNSKSYSIRQRFNAFESSTTKNISNCHSSAILMHDGSVLRFCNDELKRWIHNEMKVNHSNDIFCVGQCSQNLISEKNYPPNWL